MNLKNWSWVEIFCNNFYLLNKKLLSILSSSYIGGSSLEPLGGDYLCPVDSVSGQVLFSVFIGTYEWWLSRSGCFSFQSSLIQCLVGQSLPTWQTLRIEETIDGLLSFLSSKNDQICITWCTYLYAFLVCLGLYIFQDTCYLIL